MLTMTLTAAAWAKSGFACGLLGLSDRRGVRWGLLCLVAFVNVVAVGGIVTQWVRCRPIYKAWVVSVDGKCFARATSNAVAITVQGQYWYLKQGTLPWVTRTDHIIHDSMLRLRRSRLRGPGLYVGLVKWPQAG